MSTNRSYLEQIDDEIALHREELDRLEIARQVIARLAGKTAKAETPQAAKAPATGITIRRVETPAPAPAAKTEKTVTKKTLPAGRTPERKAHKAMIREQVMEQLKSEPLSSTTLITRLLPADADKSDKQTIYDALYILKSTGTLKRDDDALYHLVKPPMREQATSH